MFGCITISTDPFGSWSFGQDGRLSPAPSFLLSLRASNFLPTSDASFTSDDFHEHSSASLGERQQISTGDQVPIDENLGSTLTFLGQVEADVVEFKKLANLVGLHVVRILIIAVNHDAIFFEGLLGRQLATHILQRHRLQRTPSLGKSCYALCKLRSSLLESENWYTFKDSVATTFYKIDIFSRRTNNLLEQLRIFQILNG